MSYEVLEKKPKLAKTEPYPNYRVVLINDNRNNFEHVENCLVRHIPGMSSDKAHQIVIKVHKDGAASVWAGPKEVAEMYCQVLQSEGLTTTIEPDA